MLGSLNMVLQRLRNGMDLTSIIYNEECISFEMKPRWASHYYRTVMITQSAPS